MTVLNIFGEDEGLYLLTIDGQPVAASNVVTNTKPTLTGRVQMLSGVAGVVVRFNLPSGAEDGTLTTDVDGKWTYTYQNDIPPGDYDLSSLIVVDLPVGAEVTDTFTVDDPITFVGSAQGVTSVVMPAHQAGDLIVACVFRDGGAFTVPAGWTLAVNRSAGGYDARILYKIAQSNAETVNGFTSATDLVALVYRSAKPIGPIGGTATAYANSGSVSKPAGSITFANADSSSWVIAVGASRNNGTAIAFSNYTERQAHANATTTSKLVVADSNGPVNTDLSAGFTTGGSDGVVLAVEIRSY